MEAAPPVETLSLKAEAASVEQSLKKSTRDRYAGVSLKDFAVKLQALGMEPSKDPARKLKDWIEAGRYDKEGNLRAAPEWPPFDHPEQLAAWWRSCMRYKAPQWMVNLEKNAAYETAEESPRTPAGADRGSGVPAAKSDDELIGYGDIVFSEDVGGDVGVMIAREFVRDNLRRFAEARRIGNMKLARQIRDELRDDIEDLRKQEAAALKTLEGKGEYLRARVMLTEANRVFSMLSTSFYNGMDALVRKVAPKLPAVERRELVLDQRDVVFEHIQNTNFASAWVPPAEVDAV